MKPKEGHFEKVLQTDKEDIERFERECMIKAPLLDSEKKVKKHYKRLIKEIQYQN